MRWQDEVAEANAVAPQMFKSLAGRGHSAFSSNHQQVGGMHGRGGLFGQPDLHWLPCVFEMLLLMPQPISLPPPRRESHFDGTCHLSHSSTMIKVTIFHRHPTGCGGVLGPPAGADVTC